MSQGNPHFQANVINPDDEGGTGKAQTPREVADVRRQQVEHANEHARAFPAGNARFATDRDERGNLTRAAMIGAIANGGSVLVPHGVGPFGGRIVSRVEDLPTDAELAQGDPDQERRAMEAIDAQQKELDRQRVAIADARANRERTAELAEKRGVPQTPSGGPGDLAKGPGDAASGSEQANAIRRKQEQEGDDADGGEDPRDNDADKGPSGHSPASSGGKGTQTPPAPPQAGKTGVRK